MTAVFISCIKCYSYARNMQIPCKLSSSILRLNTASVNLILLRIGKYFSYYYPPLDFITRHNHSLFLTTKLKGAVWTVEDTLLLTHKGEKIMLDIFNVAHLTQWFYPHTPPNYKLTIDFKKILSENVPDTSICHISLQNIWGVVLGYLSASTITENHYYAHHSCWTGQ